jgi:GNAT superfamily N-acetyltransferase
MSEYEIKPLDASTWDAFARLVEKHNGCGFGGITCIFVDRDYRRRGVAGVALRGALELIAKAGGGVVEGYPHDLQQGEKMRSQFLYNSTRSLYEQTGFSYDRPKGKKNCVMRTTVAPVKASRRARVGRL